MEIISQYSVPFFIIFSLAFGVSLVGASCFSCPSRGSMLSVGIGLSVVLGFYFGSGTYFFETFTGLFGLPPEHIIYMLFTSCICMPIIFPFILLGEPSVNHG